MNRREFLKSAAFAAAGALVAGFKEAKGVPAKAPPEEIALVGEILDRERWADVDGPYVHRWGYESIVNYEEGFVTFFVEPGVGDDENNDGTDPRSPLNTLSQAINNAGSFDVIVFLPSDETREAPYWFRVL